MSLFRRNAKRDANEADVVDTFRALGCLVLKVSGEGLPDLIVGIGRKWVLVEVKDKDGDLTPAQQTVAATIRFRKLPFAVVRSSEDAEALVSTLKGK